MSDIKTNDLRDVNLEGQSQQFSSDPSSAFKTSIAIVVPCFNEQSAIPNLCEKLSSALPQLKRFEIEFVFVDDGSSDDTFDLLHDHFGEWDSTKIVRHDENRGLMAAMMTGVRHTNSELICTIDSDCTYDPSGLVDLLDKMRPGVGLVTGSPYHPDGEVLNVPGWRVGISYMASWMYRQILHHPLYCYTAIFRVYRAQAIRSLSTEDDGFVGNTELLWKVEAADWQIVEVPSVLDVRQFGQSKMNTFRVAVRHLKLMWKIVTSRFRTTSMPAGATAKD